jgi:hypothetical protein
MCRGASPPLLAELRTYSEPGNMVLPDNVIAFVVAKATVPVVGTVELEGMYVVPLPGDPISATYSAHLPNFWYPLVFAHGVVGPDNSGSALGISTFGLVVREFVRGTMKDTDLV